MTPEEFVLTQERIDNVEAHCMAIEKDLAEYKDSIPTGHWLEKRTRVLEEKVRLLMDIYNKQKDLRNGKRTETDS